MKETTASLWATCRSAGSGVVGDVVLGDPSGVADSSQGPDGQMPREASSVGRLT